MGATLGGSGLNGATIHVDQTVTEGEIVTQLVNASDGQGLHFDGAAGNIDIPGSGSAPVVELGTKFSFEYILQADEWSSTSNVYLTDFGSSGRFIFGSSTSGTSNNLGAHTSSWASFGINPLTDLKVHHLVLTVDDTAIVLYDNGNEIGTATLPTSPTIDLAADARIGASNDGFGSFFNGTIYRCRFWNKTLSQPEVTDAYENATVPFADQYGSQTEKVTNGTFASDTGWTKNSAWSIGSGVATADGSASNSLYQSGVISSTGGKRYRYSFDYTRTSGTSLGVQYHNGSSYVDIATGAETGTNTATGEFVTTGTPDGYIYFTANGNWAGTLDNVTLVAAGCVADYDLAFSNPEISFMVQDRAGAADGEASNDGTNPTGISQVTPLVQVNATAARIGTTAATPADGELLVSGNVGVGTATPGTYDSRAERLVIHEAGDGGITIATGAASDGRLVFAQSGDTGLDHGEISYDQNTEAMGFATAGTGRLTIDSDGNVGIGASAADYEADADNLVVCGAAHAGLTIATGTAHRGSIYFADGTTGTDQYDGFIDYNHSTRAMRLGTGGGNARLTIDSDGNVGVGVTPNANWSGTGVALQLGNAAHIVSSGEYLYSGSNYYYNSGWKYATSAAATKYAQGAGAHTFSVAASGTADGDINTTGTWTDALTIDSAGAVSITTSAAATNQLKVTSTDGTATVKTYSTADGSGLIINQNYAVGGPPYLRNADFVASVEDASASQMRFFTKAASANPALALTIYSTGLAAFEAEAEIVGDIRHRANLNVLNAAADGWNAWATRHAATGTVELSNIRFTDKQNLLTNSGFDVWSNSTLEDVGSDLVTNGTFASDTGWTKNAGWTITGGKGVATSATSGYAILQTIPTTVVGKLYKFTVTVSDFSAGGISLYNPSYFSPDISITADGTYTFTVEALAAFTSFQIRASGTTTLKIDDVTFTEVTPGCVEDTDTLAMDGWRKAGGIDLFRDQTTTKDGSLYSLKIDNTAGEAWDVAWPAQGGSSLGSKPEILAKFKNRTVTLGAWIKADGSNEAWLSVQSSAGTANSTKTSSSDWTWVEVTATTAAVMTTGMTWFACYVVSDSGSVHHVSQPMLVFGSAIGSGNYSRPSGEIVWCEGNATTALPNYNSVTVSSDASWNLEVETNGRVPKGAKAVHLTYYGIAGTADSYFGFGPEDGQRTTWGTGWDTTNRLRNSGWVNCDSNGDIYLDRNNTWTAVTVLLNAVELR